MHTLALVTVKKFSRDSREAVSLRVVEEKPLKRIRMSRGDVVQYSSAGIGSMLPKCWSPQL